MRNCLFLVFFISIFGCASKKVADQDRAQIYYASGTQHLVSKKYTDALSDLLEAVKLDPENDLIHNNLGMAYYFKNDIDSAISHINKALKLNEKNMDAHNNLASILYAQKRFDEAKIHYNFVLKDLTYPGQFRTNYNLGLIELQQKNILKARDYFSKSIEDNENHCPAYYQLGLLDFDKQDYQAAYDNFKYATLGECTNHPEPVYHQGITSMKLGNSERAKLKFIDLIKRFPKHSLAPLAEAQLNRLQKLEESSVNEVIKENKTEPTLQSFVSP